MMSPSWIQRKAFVETMFLYSRVGAPVPVHGSYIAIFSMLLVPTSRGSLQVISSSPEDPSAMDPNFYDTKVDRTGFDTWSSSRS